MDKTYAETQHAKPFDWNLFLANPPERRSAEHNSAQHLAGEWTTCACGNQCAIIPRSTETDFSEQFLVKHAPIDRELRLLGGAFWVQIDEADWTAARTTLAAIEARSAVLIREELAKLNAP